MRVAKQPPCSYWIPPFPLQDRRKIKVVKGAKEAKRAKEAKEAKGEGGGDRARENIVKRRKGTTLAWLIINRFIKY